MLTAAENELLTRVGPGSRMGAFLRRYWHPVAGAAEMAERWTKRVRLLGEDLVLFKDRSGRFGLVGEFCPHRRASLAYGIPTDDGIRCPYHGWKFDGTGACLEQPNEPAGSGFKDKVRTSGYPVAELGGVLWAYLGPSPAPLVPPLDGFVDERPAIRQWGRAIVNCNWLQIMENSLDPVHSEWLHGVLYEFLLERDGLKTPIAKHHLKIAFDEFPYGLIKRRLLEGQKEDASDWTTGHPVFFPLTLAVGSAGGLWQQYAFQIRVPIDDTHTYHYWYNAYIPPAGFDLPPHLLRDIPVYDVPVRDERGEYMLTYFHAQDIMAWETQGPIADRSTEALAASDRGVTLWRRLLARELEKSERGEDPMNVFRDEWRGRRIDLPQEVGREHWTMGFERMHRMHVSNWSPVRDDIIHVFTTPAP
jgi:5,5'-dehydrodivanillate O-demethylase oxygenase subunit